MSVRLQKKVKKVSQTVNHVAFLIDVSGSMARLEEKVVNVCNKNINDLREESLKHGQTTYVSVLIFDTKTDVVIDRVNVKDIRNINYTDVRNRRDLTRLRDGIFATIDFLEKTKLNKNDDNSFLLIGLTDGGENDSRNISPIQMRQLVEKCKNKGNWTLTFNVPKGHKQSIVNLGFYDDNVREWETTERGLETMSQVNTKGLTSYFTCRGAGGQSVKNFYQVDLGDLQTKDLKQLKNLQNNFKIYDVIKESPIKEFVEEKGYTYTPGSCFYELTKKETVQANKEILVQEKGKSAIYGGQEARSLIGLPNNTDVKVEPLNLSKYRVFILSTSVNRKLVRGTKLVITI